jgi:DNA-binding protein H-NS
MANLVDIQTQIEKLQKQASDIRVKEFEKTVREIVNQMQAFGITIRNLQQAMSKAGPGKKRRKPATKKVAVAKKRGRKGGATVAAKYRGPNGETWSGRGLTPRWLSALVAQGRKKEDFVIKA